MMTKYLVALALAGQLTTAHGEVTDDKNASITASAPGAVDGDAPSCPGPPPPPRSACA